MIKKKNINLAKANKKTCCMVSDEYNLPKIMTKMKLFSTLIKKSIENKKKCI